MNYSSQTHLPFFFYIESWVLEMLRILLQWQVFSGFSTKSILKPTSHWVGKKLKKKTGKNVFLLKKQKLQFTDIRNIEDKWEHYKMIRARERECQVLSVNAFQNIFLFCNQSDHTVGMMLVLHAANLGLINGMPYGPLSMTKKSSWAQNQE